MYLISDIIPPSGYALFLFKLFAEVYQAITLVREAMIRKTHEKNIFFVFFNGKTNIFYNFVDGLRFMRISKKTLLVKYKHSLLFRA